VKSIARKNESLIRIRFELLEYLTFQLELFRRCFNNQSQQRHLPGARPRICWSVRFAFGLVSFANCMPLRVAFDVLNAASKSLSIKVPKNHRIAGGGATWAMPCPIVPAPMTPPVSILFDRCCFQRYENSPVPSLWCLSASKPFSD